MFWFLLKDKSIKEKIHQLKDKFLTRTTAHGIPNIFEASNIYTKLFWIFAIITSLAFGGYEMYLTTNDYYKYDVITNTDRKFFNSMTFPAITICNFGWYQKRRFKNNKQISYEKVIDKSLEKFIDYEQTHFNRTLFTREDLEFFKIPQRNGDCLRINGGVKHEPFTVQESKDFLFVAIKDNYTEYISPTEKILYSRMGGYINIFVKDNYQNSFIGQLASVTAETGYFTALNIEKTDIITRLPEPYNKCNSDKGDNIQINCIDICIVREIKKKYLCLIDSYYTANDTGVKCGWNMTKYLNEYSPHVVGLAKEFYGTCKDQCFSDCESTRFSTRVLRAIKYDYTRLRFSVVDFSTLEIKQINKYGFFDFISNLGGLLGLFIGASFLSFAEIFEFIINSFYIVCF